MKTQYRWLVAALLLGVLAALSLGIKTRLVHNHRVASQTRHFSRFSTTTADGQQVQVAPLDGQPTVLIYFDPDCDHCQQEARAYRSAMASLGKTRVLWLASVPQPVLQRFVRNYGLAPAQVLYLDQELAYRRFGFTTVPDIMVYGADGNLARRFKGQTSFSQIKAAL